MFANQKLLLLLSLVALSFAVELEDELDKRVEEEPKLIGVTQGIMSRRIQEIGLIFQNSKLSSRGLQSLYIREKETKALYTVPLECKNTSPFTKNIMNIFCKADLKTPNVEAGNYIIECIKYKDLFFIDEKTQLEVLNSHDLEFIGIQSVIQKIQVSFYFNYNKFVDPKLLKLLKFAKDGKEYELALKHCYNNSQYDYVFCDDSWPNIEIGKYEVKYLVYNNETMKPKTPLYFNYITNMVCIQDFPYYIKRNKREEINIRFCNGGGNEPIEFYFRGKDHSYILYKINSYPIGGWDVDDSTYDWKCYRKYVFDTDNIPKGTYKLEFVYQKVRKQPDITFELID